MDDKIINVIENLKKNNMNALYVDKKEDVIDCVKNLISKGESISVGGSVSLEQCGLIDFFRNGDYEFLDRANCKSYEESQNLARQSVFSDNMFTSTNAITEKGQLYCVDGKGTRVSLMIFGPKKVFVVASINKIVKNLDEAAKRVREIAGPLNTKRLNRNTYCKNHGKCINCDTEEMIPNNDNCPNTICSDYVVFQRQMIPGRMTVILVGEQLGF